MAEENVYNRDEYRTLLLPSRPVYFLIKRNIFTFQPTHTPTRLLWITLITWIGSKCEFVMLSNFSRLPNRLPSNAFPSLKKLNRCIRSKCCLCFQIFNFWTSWPIFTKLDMNITSWNATQKRIFEFCTTLIATWWNSWCGSDTGVNLESWNNIQWILEEEISNICWSSTSV
jgi:hypothetical protein